MGRTDPIHLAEGETHGGRVCCSHRLNPLPYLLSFLRRNRDSIGQEVPSCRHRRTFCRNAPLAGVVPACASSTWGGWSFVTIATGDSRPAIHPPNWMGS